MRQADRDEGRRQYGLTTAEHEELGRLRWENRALREGRAILKNMQKALMQMNVQLHPFRVAELGSKPAFSMTSLHGTTMSHSLTPPVQFF